MQVSSIVRKKLLYHILIKTSSTKKTLPPKESNDTKSHQIWRINSTTDKKYTSKNNNEHCEKWSDTWNDTLIMTWHLNRCSNVDKKHTQIADHTTTTVLILNAEHTVSYTV